MSAPYESADLLLKLYDLRREDKMREARDWYFREFNPNSVDDVMQTLMGQHSGLFRMVTSYWDMAAALVLNGAIDEKMFNDTNGEQLGVFMKIQPVLADYRAKIGNPAYLASLEKVVLNRPGAVEMMAAFRERWRSLATGR